MKEGLLNNKNAQRGEEKRQARLNLRVLLSDKQKWQSVAFNKHMTLAAWIEDTLNSAIANEEQK
ncbi:hypothetical protein KW443_09130 [Vibrio fluvialis]|nr:hypothetical protein [Vibrio fluvialis]